LPFDEHMCIWRGILLITRNGANSSTRENEWSGYSKVSPIILEGKRSFSTREGKRRSEERLLRLASTARRRVKKALDARRMTAGTSSLERKPQTFAPTLKSGVGG